MHAHFEVGSISGVPDLADELSRFTHQEMVPAFKETVHAMIRTGEVGLAARDSPAGPLPALSREITGSKPSRPPENRRSAPGAG